MNDSSQLFVGVTTWNSELLLPHCLDSLKRTAPNASVVILDNMSIDNTRQIAHDFGARVISKNCGQGDALNELVRVSDRPYTLLIHADVILLSPNWVGLVLSKLQNEIALVSPEDIGCGPYTRPWGRDKPESSFMCFVTQHLKAMRERRWYRRFRIPYYRNQFDFYGDHITYNIPQHLFRAGLNWLPMSVHVSEKLEQPHYVPDFGLPNWHWSPEFGYLKYGLGNFYSLDGVVTHYHNWYDRRVDKTKQGDPKAMLEMNGQGLPVAYLKSYTDNFIEDYRSGRVTIPAGLLL